MSSEVKRISLKTVSINNNNNNNNNNNSDKSETNKKSKDNNKSKDNKEPKTKRFVLQLNTDSNECNEFSYNDLIKTNVDKNGDQLNGLKANDDPLADNNEEYKLRQLEKEFQEKYGPKKRSQWEDYIDKGMGYDETDPFIDNEEAYDELVPSTLTTQYGGFYINCGELEFRPLSADENDNDDDEDNIRPVLKRKRKLELESGKRRRSSTDLNRKSRKNKIPSPGKTVAQMLQQKKLQQTNENDNEIEEIEINDSNSSAAVVVSASVRDIVDSVAKGEDQGNDDERNGSVGSSDAEDIKKDNSIPVVKLPDGLPPELSSTIDKIKKLAHSSQDGKRNFFSQDVNKMLYDIEKKSRELLPSHRTQIYSHLASHLPCTKQTLMSRAKKVLCETNEYNLQTAIANIRTIVVSLQSEVIIRYRKQCEEIKQTFERNKQNGLISPQTELKFPKRLFPWNDKLRTLFNEAIHYKINLYEQLGPKNQSITLRDYLYEFFDKEIKPIWPKGWMGLEILKQKSKWVKQILPPEQQSPQQSSQQTTQSTSQPIAHSSHTSAPNQSSQQIVEKANKVQTPVQQTSDHKKPPTFIEIFNRQSSEIVANNDNIESIEQKLPSNTTIKSLSSSQTMPKMNDQMSEGLGGKFIPAIKEVKDNVNNSSIDLSTKARSSPKPLNTLNVRLSPVNLKTSPNITVVKSNSPSPSVSPLAMTSILQSTKQLEKISRESCLQKVIEQSLGDFPNSSANSQRNSKTSLLPQTSSPNTEMFIKGFNSTPNSKTDICIEIASSPEPYKKVQHQQQSHHQKHLLQQIQQQKLHQKAQQSQQKIVNKHLSTTTTTSTTNSPSNQHVFHRNSDMHKNKSNVSNVSNQSSMNSVQKQEMRQTAQTMDHLLLQSQIARNANRDTSISITPIPQKSSESNSNSSSKHHSNQNSRYSNSASVITSTSSPMNLAANQQLLNLHMWSNLSPQLLSSYNASTFHRLFGAQTPQPFVPTSTSQSHNLYYPQFTTPSTTTTTTHQTGEGRGRTPN